MNVALYARCSTDMQDDSVEDQLALMRRYCKRENLTIVAEYVDEAVSGGIPIAQRPSARRMLEDAKSRKFHAIVAKQQDRLGRNAADSISFCEMVKSKNIKLLFVHESYADTPVGRLNFNIVAVISQFYRENIGQLIKDHNLERARKGLWRGGTPALGLKLDKETGKLIVNEDRAEHINLVFETYVKNNGSREATAKELNRLGIPSSGNKPWEAIRIKRLVYNPIYIGKQRYDGNEYEIEVPEVVPAELVMQARRLFEMTQGKKIKSTANSIYPYSNVVCCGDCGSPMWCAHPSVASRGISPIYRCRHRVKTGLCNGPGISESKLDRLIIPQLPIIISSYKNELVEAVEIEQENNGKLRRGKGNSKGNSNRNSVPNQKKKLEDEKSRLLDAYVSGLIDKALFEIKMQDIESRTRALENAPGDEIKNVELESIIQIIENIDKHWGKFTPMEKKKLLQIVTPKIVVYPSRQWSKAEIHSPLLSKVLVCEIWA